MYAIAIDSGGTKIVGAVVDDQGNIHEKARHDNDQLNGDNIVQTYKVIIKEYKEKYEISVVGVGCNGRINVRDGMVADCARYTNWQGRFVQKELEEAHGLPVSLNNDCYAGIMGEVWMGAAKEYDSVVGIILGTGVGGGIYDSGSFFYGAHFGGGELGHMILHKDGYPCMCGQNGCVERYISGTALWNIFNELVGEERIHSGYEFFDLFSNGDVDAKKVLSGYVSNLALAMTNIANLCDPGAFLIGGGLADTHEIWDCQLQEQYINTVGAYLCKTPIVYAARGNDAALLGAAKFGFDKLKRM